MTMFNVTPPCPLFTQRDTASCWLASCKMLFAWKNRNPNDVDDILKTASAKDDRVDYDNWCQNGIGQDDLVPLAKALGFKWGAGGVLDAGVLRDTLKTCGPMLAVGAWNGSSHVIVVTAIDADDDFYPILLNNPWPEPGTTVGAIQSRNLNWFNKGLGTWQGINGQYQHW
jgi:hypothetical protein